jgi:zinc transport system ATP-binding protein
MATPASDHGTHTPCCQNHGQNHGVAGEGASEAVRERRPLISGRGLTVRRGGRVLLDQVDVAVGPAEIVTLIGPNGAGKTTLVRVLLGLEPPDLGQVTTAPSLRLGYVPQRFDVDRAMPLTVRRFLQLGGGGPPAALDAALSEVGAAALDGEQLSNLSGGELQRVLLARALIRNPQLLILDEPVRGVDYTGEAELYALISRLRQSRGLGVLLISHDLHVVMAQSDRVICLNRHVCCHGVPHAVARHPEYERLFGSELARMVAVYEHHHDHHHGLGGRADPVPTPTPDPPAR